MAEIRSDKAIKWIIMAGIAICLVIFISFLSFGDEEYLRNMADYRRERDNFFKKSAESPIPPEDRAAFAGATYFPVDPDFRIRADFVEEPGNQRIQLPRTGGDTLIYIKAGKALFELDGKSYSLLVYQPELESPSEVFVPFRDLTSGKTTYGGGRYIDTRIVNEQIDLDFNKAYQPYCYYNPEFSCPIPPKENYIGQEIRAGEKNVE